MKTPQISVRIGALFIVAAGCNGSAFAQKPPAAVADCRSIAASMERLACYDAASERSATAGKNAATPVTVPAAAASSEVARAEPAATVASRTPSIIDSTWGFDPSSARNDISFHNSNYLLFGRYTDNVNNAPYSPLFQAAGQPQENLNDVEAKFQLSFKARLWTTDDRRWGVWAAYTQQSQWQVYNGDVSRPFRENNNMPE